MQAIELLNGVVRTALSARGSCNHWMDLEDVSKNKFHQATLQPMFKRFFATEQLVKNPSTRKCTHCSTVGHNILTCPVSLQLLTMDTMFAEFATREGEL